MQVQQHKQGTPSWAELVTTDDAAAVRFYHGLFGWHDDAMPMGDEGVYHMQLLQGDNIAAIANQRAEEQSQHPAALEPLFRRG